VSASTPAPAAARPIIGQASWYGNQFANRPTASGTLFDPEKLTAAHRKLPLGTKVVVTNLHNGRSVLVTINDRGPYWGNRDIDLSYRAARVLGMVRRGVARVRTGRNTSRRTFRASPHPAGRRRYRPDG